MTHSASAMRDMSRAIRHELEAHGERLSDIPLPTLKEITTIVHAYYLDLKEELERRDDET